MQNRRDISFHSIKRAIENLFHFNRFDFDSCISHFPNYNIIYQKADTGGAQKYGNTKLSFK